MVDCVVVLVIANVGFLVMIVATSYVGRLDMLEADDMNLLNSMQEGIFVLNKDMTSIKFGSKTALRIMDYKQDKLAGCDMQKNVDIQLFY